MRDAFSFSQDGIPATVVVTTPFERLARLTLASCGEPEFEVMVINHPIWTRNQAWLEAEAERLAGPLIGTLFASTQTPDKKSALDAIG